MEDKQDINFVNIQEQNDIKDNPQKNFITKGVTYNSINGGEYHLKNAKTTDPTKSKKSKRISMIIAFSIMILLIAVFLLKCTAISPWASSEDKKAVYENSKMGRSLIEEYLADHYNGAKIQSLDSISHGTWSLFPSSYVTKFVKAKVKYKKQKFEVLADVESKKVYDNYSYDSIKSSIIQYVNNDFRATDIRDIEVHYSPNEFTSYGEMADHDGMAEAGITNIDDLMIKHNYTLRVLLKYSDESIDLSKIDATSFFNKFPNRDIHFGFVKFRGESRYNNDQLYRYSYTSTIGGDYYYQIREILIYTTKDDIQFTIENYDTTTSGALFVRHMILKSKKIKNMEFVWSEPFVTDVSIREIPMSSDTYNISEEYGIGESYFLDKMESLPKTGIEITAILKDGEDTSFNSSTIFCFAEKKDTHLIRTLILEKAPAGCSSYVWEFSHNAVKYYADIYRDDHIHVYPQDHDRYPTKYIYIDYVPKDDDD